jgi:endonuclease/exonuclease/phosphatase family metal-dependent hydrolase
MASHGSVAMIRTGTRGVSALLCVGIALCYWRRPDSCALITLYPAWAWFIVGAALLFLSWRRTDLRAIIAFAALWLVFMLLFAEESRSLLRGIGGHLLAGQRVALEQGDPLRVVSMNCAGGSEAAAAEAMQQEADVILLQESPPAETLQRLSDGAIGADAAVVCGLDCAIIVDGQAEEIPLPTEVGRFAVRARVTTSMGVEADVISLHLLPPVLSFNILSPDCWRSQRANRTARREQIALIAAEVGDSAAEGPLILGGDFNAPGGDGASRALGEHLRDSFRQAGAGWGNTATNDFPLLRFDQVWVSKHWRVNRLSVQKSEHSDHRMVICDLIRETGQGRPGEAARSSRASPRE